MGHAGFRESAALIAHAMKWELSEIAETCEPIVAQQDLCTEYFDVPKGKTCGLHQRAVGLCAGDARIELDLQMFLGAPAPHDRVRIDGDPKIEACVEGGVAGDHATVAALLNAVPRLLRTPPGIRLMTELALPCWC